MVAIEYLPVIIGLSETFQLCCQHFHDSHLLSQHSDLTQSSRTSTMSQSKICSCIPSKAGMSPKYLTSFKRASRLSPWPLW